MAIYKKATTRYGVSALVRRYVALAAGRTEAETEIRAQAVRYVSERDAIEIVTNRLAREATQLESQRPQRWSTSKQDGG